MEREEIKSLFKSIGFSDDTKGTDLNTFATGSFKQMGNNRNSKGWVRAQYILLDEIITDVEALKERWLDQGWVKEENGVLVAPYSPQFLMFNDGNDWHLWDSYAIEIKFQNLDEMKNIIGIHFFTSTNISKPHQIIFYGAPGTGKSFRIKEKLKALNVPKDNIIRTTFHPDSDYSTFVGAYKPTRGLKPLYGLNGTNTVRLNDGKDLSEEIITYKFVAQAFLKAYIKAYEKPEENVYLVIEEINRGNCAQIFGDLFQLLDRDADGKSEYTIKADDDLKVFLEDKFQELGVSNDGIAGGELCLPSNLYIYATMNTSDQSLFPIDSAFKRRWDWEYEPIKYNHDLRISIAGVNYKWTSFQEKVNALIKLATNSEDKMLGDYFVNPANGVIDENTLRNKVLFYLWNDVCKDGEGDIFKVSDNKELTFSELYGNEGTSNLQKMMQYLAIEEYEDETESEEEDDDANEENGRNESNTTQKDFSTYRINGQGEYRKRILPFETIKKYVGQNPEKNATDILNELRTIKAENPVLPYNFIADETEYSNLSSDAKGRVKALNVNGENIYISNQWKFDNIKKFIEVVNNSNWGILIESVSTNN